MLDLLTVGPKFTRPASRTAAAAIDRYLLPAPDLSSKPAGRRCCCRSTGQTDGRKLSRFMTLTTQCADGARFNMGISYLSEHCIPVYSADTRRHLRSANRHLNAVPRFRLNTYGRRAFSVAGPMAWNSLPDFIRDPTSSTDCFRRRLKTYRLRVTSASSALAVFNHYALYKSTHSLTHSLDNLTDPNHVLRSIEQCGSIRTLAAGWWVSTSHYRAPAAAA